MQTTHKKKERTLWETLIRPVVWGFHATEVPPDLPIKESAIPVDFHGADLNGSPSEAKDQVAACRSVQRGDYVAYRYNDAKRRIDEIWVGKVNSDSWRHIPGCRYPEWRDVVWAGAHKPNEFPPGIAKKIAPKKTICRMGAKTQEYADAVKRLCDEDFRKANGQCKTGN